MNMNPSFVRKVIYLSAIAALLFPLFLLGTPATQRRPGGQLSQLRADYNLAEARLGEIDPASESMKLATLGMRGVAASLLWHKANEYKKTEDWDNLSATLNQITKLQPHFIAVWENQAHNLSYNVSVEFDDYRHRYHWVKKGIDFLVEGTRFNRQEPRLLWYTGWFFGQKFGRADEHRQFRRIFRQDDDFKNEMQTYVDVEREGLGPDNKPDNWLVGRLWYQKAQQLVDTQGVPIRGKSPLIFHSQLPMSRINHAATIEEEGFLDEKAELAWRTAANEWRQYGSRVIPTSWGENIRLNDLEPYLPQYEQMKKDLDALVPDVRQQMRDERFQTLTKAEKEALEVPLEQRVGDQIMAGFEAENKLRVAPRELAERAPEAVRNKAKRLAARIEAMETTLDRISRYRNQVNFEYWRMRCEAEQLAKTVQARKHMYEANLLKDRADLETARREYEAAWKLWAEIFEQFPALVEDRSDDIADAIENYQELLAQLEEKLPEDFPLKAVREANLRATGRLGSSTEAPESMEDYKEKTPQEVPGVKQSDADATPASDPAPADAKTPAPANEAAPAPMNEAASEKSEEAAPAPSAEQPAAERTEAAPAAEKAESREGDAADANTADEASTSNPAQP